MPKDAEHYKQLRILGIAFAIPALMVTAPGVGFLIGRWLDAWLGTERVFSIALLLLGAAGGFYEAITMIHRVGKNG